MSQFAGLKEKLEDERLKYTFPWFIHPPLKNAEYPDDFLAYGNPDDDSENYDLLEHYPEEAKSLIVAAVNALPHLLQIAEAAEAYRAAEDDVVSTEVNALEHIQALARSRAAESDLFAALRRARGEGSEHP